MATQLAEAATEGAEAGEEIVTGAPETGGDADNDTGDGGEQERDYEAEARAHGWTPKDAFRGDPAKWVDAETFARRADEVMPFLKKQNAALKRDFDDFKKNTRKALKFMGEAEQRGYERGIGELQTRLDEAVEKGDVPGARKIVKEMGEMAKPEAPDTEDKPDSKQAQREFAEWIDRNDWYVTDDKKRAYADIQAGAMGPAAEYEGGPQAWLDELGKRVDRKFAEKKPSAANPGGNRGNGGPRGAKTFSDLPPEAKAMCDKWVKQGIIKSREAYVQDYDWS